jgi:hypothetical protein
VAAVAADQRLRRPAMNPQVGAGGLGQLPPVGLEEGGELTDADQVAGHGAIGEVLARRCRSKERLRLLEDALLSMPGP